MKDSMTATTQPNYIEDMLRRVSIMMVRVGSALLGALLTGAWAKDLSLRDGGANHAPGLLPVWMQHIRLSVPRVYPLLVCFLPFLRSDKNFISVLTVVFSPLFPQSILILQAPRFVSSSCCNFLFWGQYPHGSLNLRALQ